MTATGLRFSAELVVLTDGDIHRPIRLRGSWWSYGGNTTPRMGGRR